MNQQTLKKHVIYNPDTGMFTYIKSGKLIDNKNKLGYVRVSIEGKRYLAHRLAIVYMGGELKDKEEVDHLNRVKNDNRYSNLIVGTSRDNKMNRDLQDNNHTGVNGVSFCKTNSMYEANVKTQGRKIFLGYYDSLHDAKIARQAANRVLGFSDKHGININA